MGVHVLKFNRTGVGASVQDLGRRGFARFGVPPGGVMDPHAATWANRLLDNPDNAPVIELLMQGAHLEVLRACWIAVTGADTGSNVPRWRLVRVRRGDEMHFPRSQTGLWSYIAVEGGLDVPHYLGSASVHPRGNIGHALRTADQLKRNRGERLNLPENVAGRMVSPAEQRDYNNPPPIRVWPGPQWDLFSARDRMTFFQREWTVSPQSDRVGYRLDGARLEGDAGQIISEPVLPGSIQIPQGGQPIVTMRDGPTVGGYPKIGLVHADDLPWLAQCKPGVPFRFEQAQ